MAEARGGCGITGSPRNMSKPVCYTEKASPTGHRPERQHNARSNRRKQCSPNETKPNSNAIHTRAGVMQPQWDAAAVRGSRGGMQTRWVWPRCTCTWPIGFTERQTGIHYAQTVKSMLDVDRYATGSMGFLLSAGYNRLIGGVLSA